MRVKFTDLEPCFVRLTREGNFIGDDDEIVAPDEADGVLFLNPVEFVAKGSSVGVTSVLVWFRGRVADNVLPGPGRWDVLDRNFETFTLSPSIDLTRGGRLPGQWHGFVKQGYVT